MRFGFLSVNPNEWHEGADIYLLLKAVGTFCICERDIKLGVPRLMVDSKLYIQAMMTKHWYLVAYVISRGSRLPDCFVWSVHFPTVVRTED